MFRNARSLVRWVMGIACTAAPAGAALAQIDIVTERYDDARLGANLQETQLNPSTVNVNNFGKIWSYTVSGSVYAQPLYVRNVSIPGQGVFNVLYVVTMNDVVYAFDADSSNDAPLLSFDLTTEVSGSGPVPVTDIIGFVDNIEGNVGIESTPVIDLSTNTIYLVARTEEPLGGGCSSGPDSTCVQRLHALDITTLEEKPGSPVILGGTVPCNNVQPDCNAGVLTFDPVLGDQRASLALTNGRVFIAWSAHSDVGLYHGYVMAYDAATLQQTMIWSSAPDAPSNFGAGVWMGGRAPAVDADGNVYYMTGNGTWDGVNNFGESFVKFGPTPDSPFIDWLTPADDYQLLNNFDLDLSGSGPILLPGTDLILGGGKSGYFYLQHSTDLQHLAPPANIVQVFENSRFHDDYEQIKGGPVYWNRDSGLGPWMYVWSDGCNNFNAYHFNGTDFDLPPVSQSSILSPCGSSGGVLTLSADGSTAGSGIVWSSMPQPNEDGNSHIHPGMLRAFDADDLTNELWNSTMNDARDDSGNWPKFSPPTVVNGRVYLGSFPDDGEGSTQVNVYGLLNVNPEDFSLSATPPNPGTQPGGSVTYTIDTGAINGFSATIHLDVSGLPSGANATFSANDFTPPAQPTLTIDLASLTAPGQYTLTITGTGGAQQHSVDVGLYVTNTAPGAGIISVDFVGNGAALAAIDAAGVASKPNWNEATGPTGTQLALLDESGVDTGATLDWTAAATDELNIAADSPNFVMMNGFVDAGSAGVTLTVSNLPADPNGYAVYVYSDGNNGSLDYTNTYAFVGNDGYAMTLSITDTANTNFDGMFVRAINSPGNYAIFFTDGTGFTLTATPASTGPVPINGIQIVHGNPDRIFANGFDP